MNIIWQNWWDISTKIRLWQNSLSPSFSYHLSWASCLPCCGDAHSKDWEGLCGSLRGTYVCSPAAVSYWGLSTATEQILQPQSSLGGLLDWQLDSSLLTDPEPEPPARQQKVPNLQKLLENKCVLFQAPYAEDNYYIQHLSCTDTIDTKTSRAQRIIII